MNINFPISAWLKILEFFLIPIPVQKKITFHHRWSERLHNLVTRFSNYMTIMMYWDLNPPENSQGLIIIRVNKMHPMIVIEDESSSRKGYYMSELTNPDGTIKIFMERKKWKKHNILYHQDRIKWGRKPGIIIRTNQILVLQRRVGGSNKKIHVSLRRGSY